MNYRKLFRPDILIFLASVLVFSLFPQVDLFFSGIFHDPVYEGFPLKHNLVIKIIYKTSPYIIISYFSIFILLLLLSKSIRERLNIRPKILLFLILSLLIGPGLIINTALKENWHRARPNQTSLFTGTGNMDFTPALMPSDQCPKNCSFPSGHASLGFFLMSMAFVFPRQERLWLIIGISAGLLIGLVRIVQGAHFLSDVIFSGIITWATMRILYFYMFEFNQKEPIRS
jgi:lipid A 4'-phosphatase